MAGILFPERLGEFRFMNRIIKFRNWDKRTKAWIAASYPLSCYGSTDVVSCQFTGLKAQNGDEIYEGDYVYYGNNTSYDNIAFEVVWSETCLGWVFKHDENTFLDDGWTPQGNRFDLLQVIGNRFEN